MARALILRAIDAGVPAYNSGRIQECCQIYAEAAAKLLQQSLLRAELQPGVLRALEAALPSGRPSQGEADKIAWALRRAFDEQVSEQSSRSVLVDGGRSVLNGGSGASIQAVIERAIQEGAPAFNRGDIAGCERIYTSTVRGMLDGTLASLDAEAIRLLERSLQQCQQLPDVNARAWALRKALDELLSISQGQRTTVSSGGRQKAAGSELLISNFATGEGLEFVGRVVNDTVMGGRSDSDVLMSNEGALFQGNVTRRGGGGFASLRFDPRDPVAFAKLLSSGKGIAVCANKLKGPSGWKMQLNSKQGLQWQQDFQASGSSNSIARIPFASMMPTFRGMPQGNPGLSEQAIQDIQGFGFMLSFLSADGSNNSGFAEGEFALRIISVSVYR